MFGFIFHSNVLIEFSLNPRTWYVLPKFEHKGPTPAFPKYSGFNVFWLFLRVYTYVDNGTIDVVAMYEQQEREQYFVEEH